MIIEEIEILINKLESKCFDLGVHGPGSFSFKENAPIAQLRIEARNELLKAIKQYGAKNDN